MTRHSWFSANWPITIRSLAARLQALPFTDETQEGFLLERVREASLEAIFYRKIVPSSSRIDPFGKEIPSEIAYQQVSFLASESALGLELVDAPRSNQRFVSRLLEICDFALTIGTVSVNINEWAAAITSSLGVASYVDVVQYGGIDLGRGATARVVVRGAKEVRDAANDLVSRSHTVEKMQLKLSGNLLGNSVLLSHSGTAKIAGRESALLTEATRSGLLSLATSRT